MRIELAALGLALLVCFALAGALWWRSVELDDLRRTKAALTNELAFRDAALAQAQAARAVAEARAAQQAARVVELDGVRDWINQRGDNAALPDVLRGTFDRLYRGPN
jgi:hypothetical protein